MTTKEIEDALPKKVKLVIEGKKYVYVRKDVVKELRKRNPYPEDVFISEMGKFGKKIWNCCCDELEEILKDD